MMGLEDRPGGRPCVPSFWMRKSRVPHDRRTRCHRVPQMQVVAVWQLPLPAPSMSAKEEPAKDAGLASGCRNDP